MKPFMLILICCWFMASVPVRAEEVWKVGQVAAPGFVKDERAGRYVRFLKILAHEAGVQFDIKHLSAKRNLQSLHKGEIDMIIGFLLPPKIDALNGLNVRISDFHFTEIDFYLYSLNKIEGKQLSGLRVGTFQGNEALFEEELIGLKCVSCALKMVAKNRLDAYLSASIVAEPVLEQEGITELRKSFFASFPLLILFRKDLPKDIENRLQQAFIRSIRSGVYEKTVGVKASKSIIKLYMNQ